MNHGNVCKDLAVSEIITETPIVHMMNLQILLQERLKKIPDSAATMFERAPMVIYWRHCIHSECDELLEWYEDDDADFQELEMEIVDIMHFVFNVGIVLGLEPKAVEEMMIGYLDVHDGLLSHFHDIPKETLICNLSRDLTKLIDMLPWKTWKNYDVNLEVDLDTLHYCFARVVQSNFELANHLGMKVARIVSVYCAKNAENHARQDRNY